MNYSNTAIFSPPAGGGGGSFLIDEVGVSAISAQSFRKLISSYSGPCIQVRRLSDNTTQDIGFDGNGNLDTSAISSFCGASVGTVAKWYDQSGNGYDMAKAVYTTPIIGDEPIIYYNEGGGAAITRDANNNVAMYSREPGSTETRGLRWLVTETAMPSRISPNYTIIQQYNVYSNPGIGFAELTGGYTAGCYETGGIGIRVIDESGFGKVTTSTISSNRTDPFHITYFFNRGGAFNTGKLWASSFQGGITTGFPQIWNASGTYPGDGVFDQAVFMAFSPIYGNSNVLYPNMTGQEFIYWDIPEGSTFTDEQALILTNNINAFYGFTTAI